MADDPMVAAARYVLLRNQLPLLRECVAEAPSEALNWRPGGADTNSIAVLATHTMHSTRSWMSVALGAPLPDRDRESEFRVTVDATSELLALVDALTADIDAAAGRREGRRRLGRHAKDATARNPGAPRVGTGGPGDAPHDRTRVGACGAHAAHAAVVGGTGAVAGITDGQRRVAARRYGLCGL